MFCYASNMLSWQTKKLLFLSRTVSISSEDDEDSLLRELNQALEGSEDTDGGEEIPQEKQQNQVSGFIFSGYYTKLPKVFHLRFCQLFRLF